MEFGRLKVLQLLACPNQFGGEQGGAVLGSFNLFVEECGLQLFETVEGLARSFFGQVNRDGGGGHINGGGGSGRCGHLYKKRVAVRCGKVG